MKTNVHFRSYLNHFFLECKMFQTKVNNETRNTRFMFNNVQGIHKKMVRFQKVTRNLFLNLHGHNVHRQQRQMSKFLMRYQQFASHA